MQREEKYHVMAKNKGLDVKGKSKYLVVGGGGCFIVLCVDQLVVAFFCVEFFVLLIEKCIVCSICHRETIDERGVQSKRESHAKSGASQRGTLGSLQKQQRLRHQSNAVGIPGTLFV